MRAVFVHVPTVMEFVFNAVSVFSSKRTLSKFHIVARGNVRHTLLQHISPSNLPAFYGGFEDKASAAAADAAADAVALADVTKVTIAAGKKVAVDVPVSAGERVTWEWLSVKDDIGVGAYIVGGETNDNNLKCVRSENGSAELTVDKTGTLRLVLDNSSAYFYSREVYYSIKRAPAVHQATEALAAAAPPAAAAPVEASDEVPAENAA